MLLQFLRDERGQGSLEWIALVALIILFLAAIMATVFGNLLTRGTAANAEMIIQIPDTPQ
ncbi:MAG: hypothetical protein KKA73_29290 [Chloroflexi bacterium]|nr:hypothetical protein [Chloroflexota bacterium]MBU1751791.1 hypothetical protein [Chloroflexota bacterium]